MCGYSTDRAAPVAIAASTAEPPARSASTPAEEASACGETTMPRVAIVGGLPVWMGNTARSGSRRAGQQAHHGGHARLDSEFFENVLEMLLHRARAHAENRTDLEVGLTRPGPLQHLALARREAHARGGRGEIGLDAEADQDQKPPPPRAVPHPPHPPPPPPPPPPPRTP